MCRRFEVGFGRGSGGARLAGEGEGGGGSLQRVNLDYLGLIRISLN